MAIGPTNTAPGARRMPALLLLVVGAILATYGAFGTWNALVAARHGVPASAKIVEYHGTSARSRSIVAQVDVTIPGGRPLRTEVYDAFGLGTWSDGGTIELLCSKAGTAHAECGVASPLDRWLLPVAFTSIGLVLIGWARHISR